jgi:hypothetical protein
MNTRLQGPITLSTSTVQALDKAVDLKDLGDVAVRITIANVSGDAVGAGLVLEDAAVLESGAFQPVRHVATDVARVVDMRLVGLQRYLRWRARDVGTGSLTFYIDLVARC